MSSSSTVFDHNFDDNLSEVNSFPEYNFEDNDDVFAEQISDLIGLIDDSSEVDPISLQLMGFSSEDINRVSEIIERHQTYEKINTSAINVNRSLISGHPLNRICSLASSSTSSSSSSTPSSTSSTTNQKRKSAKTSVVNNGKQLRFLFRRHGRTVINKNSLPKNESEDNTSGQRVTRSQSNPQINIDSNQRVDNKSIKANKCRTNGKNKDYDRKKDRKVTTTITRSVAKEDVATVSPESHISPEFVRQLCNYLNKIRRKGTDAVKYKKEFRPFLPIVQLERLEDLKVVSESKRVKRLKKNPNSLIQRPEISSSRVLRAHRSTPSAKSTPTMTIKHRKSSSQTIVEFKGRPFAKPKNCDNCNAANYKTYPKMMSTYLKNVFRKPKNSLKTPMRVRLSPNWSPGVKITFDEILVYKN